MGILSLPKIRKRDSRLKFHQVWTRRFLDKAYRNNSQQGVFRDHNFYSNGMASYSGKDKVSYYYTFDGLPEELPVAYVDEFRAVAKPGIKINFISFLDPTRIEWDSPAIQQKLKVWKRNSADLDDVDEYNDGYRRIKR